MTAVNRLRVLDGLLALLVGAGAFVLYTSTLAPTVLNGDAGEFQFVPYLLGVAHSTGYPLYCLLGWAWSRLLPVGDVAFRMNLFSAFCAALAVGLLYATVRRLLAWAMPGLQPLPSRLIAALASAAFAVTPTFWSQAIIAEVYGLHILFVVLLLYLLLTTGSRLRTEGGYGHHTAGFRGRSETIPGSAEEDGLAAAPPAQPKSHCLLLLVACSFGLSLTHHRTTLLLAPAFLAYLWLVDRRIVRDWRLLLKALLLIALPLLLYLYIPVRAPHSPYLNLPLGVDQKLVLYPGGLDGFFGFVLGGPFGGSVDFSVDLGGRLAMAWGLLRGEVGWVGLALALIGLLRLTVDGPRSLLALTALSFVVSAAFNLVYTIGDIFVLYVPAYLIAILWLAVGVGVLVEAVAKVLPLGSAFARAAIVLPFVALPAWTLVTHYDALDQSRNVGARQQWSAILRGPIPTDAILISNDRDDIMPMWYFQYVGDPQPLRPDLLGLFPLISPDYPTLGHVLDLAVSTDRPLYLMKEMQGVEVKVRVRAQEGLWQVLGPAAEGEPAYRLDLRLADAVSLTGFDLSSLSPRPGDELRLDLYWQALRPLDAVYHSYVHLVDADGEKVTQSDLQPGGVYYPTTLWRPGEQLQDEHLLTIPADTPPGVYRLVVGMYASAADGSLQSLGEALFIGELTIKAVE